MLDKVRRRSLG